MRTVPGVVTTSILTVGDRAPNGYRLVGLPDGLGAHDNGDGTFTLLVNHELGAHASLVRAHGSTGAFVSRWTVDSETLEVLDGGRPRSSGSSSPQSAAGGSRLRVRCRASARRTSPPWAPSTMPRPARAPRQRLLLNGEENTDDPFGRAFAHVVDGPDAGSSYVLSAFGRQEWENLVTQPGGRPSTVVAAPRTTSRPGRSTSTWERRR